MPFASTWMDLEILILSEVSQRKTNIIQYHIYVESTTKDMKELNGKTETNSQVSKPILWLSQVKPLGGGKNWEGGNNIDTLLYKIDD